MERFSQSHAGWLARFPTGMLRQLATNLNRPVAFGTADAEQTNKPTEQ
jgi:hypothetical protein